MSFMLRQAQHERNINRLSRASRDSPWAVSLSFDFAQDIRKQPFTLSLSKGDADFLRDHQQFFTVIRKPSFPPRIKYGVNSSGNPASKIGFRVKPGMTPIVKSLLRHYTNRLNRGSGIPMTKKDKMRNGCYSERPKKGVIARNAVPKQSQGLFRFARNDSLWHVYLFRAFTIDYSFPWDFR